MSTLAERVATTLPITRIPTPAVGAGPRHGYRLQRHRLTIDRRADPDTIRVRELRTIPTHRHGSHRAAPNRAWRLLAVWALLVPLLLATLAVLTACRTDVERPAAPTTGPTPTANVIGGSTGWHTDSIGASAYRVAMGVA